ncbi:MAG: terminase family protein [Puniceicoccales bacterium]|jgi:phage FluMu gp28-like protein|nr:terminase family protein [Puniceicoccales bacterium]
MKMIRSAAFFLPYQAKWIRDNSRLKLLEKSRQIGMSWATAYRMVRCHVGNRHCPDSWISSRDELQARLFIGDCRLFASLFAAAGNSPKNAWPVDGQRSSTLSLAFANGSGVHSLSSSPDAQAGKRGNRVLDEFALHGDPKLLYSIALPGITWGGQLEILSTHRGSLNFFNQLIQEASSNGNPKGFSLHRVTLQDALEQGFLEKLRGKLPADDPRRSMDEARYFDFIRASCPDEATFQQEFMCCPMDDGSAFLSCDLIGGCEFLPTEPWEISLPSEGGTGLVPANPCYLGVDLGRDNDLSVFWLLELIGDVLVTRRVDCLNRRPFVEQERLLAAFLSLSLLRRVCIDQTGLGRQFVEQAISRFGQHRVEGVTFTAATKEALAYPLRSAFERRELRIPPRDDIRADLHATRREITIAGNIRFAADRGKNGHADRFWALALALHAFRSRRSQENTWASNFQSVERSRHFLFL